MEDSKIEGVDPTEKQQEEDALKEVKEDEVRSQIVEKYELEEDTQSELIDKLVEDTKEYQKNLGTAIRQKRDWRTKAQTPKEEKKEDIPQPQTNQHPEDWDKALDQKLQKAFDEKELEVVDVSDEAKTELRTYAKAGGFTIKQVLSSDYFNFIKGKEESARKAEEASTGGKRRTSGRKDFSQTTPNDFDLSTEEGQKEYEEYKSWRKANL